MSSEQENKMRSRYLHDATFHAGVQRLVQATDAEQVIRVLAAIESDGRTLMGGFEPRHGAIGSAVALEGVALARESAAEPKWLQNAKREAHNEAQAWHAILEARRRLRAEAERCVRQSEGDDAWAQAGDEIMAVFALFDAHLTTYARTLNRDGVYER